MFPRYVESRGLSYRINARWLINHARTVRGEQLLQIVRSLDQEMNNTSVILLFQIGKKKLLFPGDAQIENWQYALGQKRYQALLLQTEVALGLLLNHSEHVDGVARHAQVGLRPLFFLAEVQKS